MTDSKKPWTEFQDDISGIILASLDDDWNSRYLAARVVTWLNETHPQGPAAPDMAEALAAAAAKLEEMGREFSSPYFTDRHGDGPAMLALAKRARAALSKAGAMEGGGA